MTKREKKQAVRRVFKEAVLTRDKYTCMICGVRGNIRTLDAHHITDRHLFKNGGYVPQNGITLCNDKCHLKAELFHMSSGREYHPGMHPDDLYAMIGSSFELAKQADETLDPERKKSEKELLNKWKLQKEK